MDMGDPHSQSRKRWRINSSNGPSSSDAKLAQKKMEEQQHGYHDEDDDGDGDGSVGGCSNNDKDRLLAWHSSRIFRVSRASGGKDRHSKVLTAKGLRDRRVRLSVSTAIQFYDLQDRLGYDQPSKAVEWLIKKAADAIAELPSLNSTAFPPTPKQASDEKRPEPEPTETDQVLHPFTFHNQQQQQQLIHLTGSACSSTSETSKGSVLSLSRSEIRVKARERARERAAKEREKDKEKEDDDQHFHSKHRHSSNPSSNPDQTSFTDLLTGGGGANASNTASLDVPAPRHHPNSDFFTKHFPQISAMDYFGQQQQAMMSPTVSKPQQHSSLFSSFVSPPPLNGLPLNISSTSAGDHPELQHFSFIPDHFIPVAQAPGAANDYNRNFSISSGPQAGFNRGTLQSNTPSSLSHHHIHKFPSSVDGPPSMPFFVSPAGPENSQFPAGFDGCLQLYYSDTCRHSDLKGKSKS